MDIENAQVFFEYFLGTSAEDFSALPQSGSSRKNFVGKSGDKKYIITFNENLIENESFFYFSRIFSELNLNTPKVLKISDDHKIYIQEFLGDHTLSEIITKNGLTPETEILVKRTLQKLFELQTKTENQIDYSNTFEYETYDELPIKSDLFYFKNFIADVLELPYQKTALLKEFKVLTQKIENLKPKALMIRDFQARNIMVNDDGEVFFIDYQSAMKGPLMYDVVSFLFQAKANFPEDFKNKMLNEYFSLWKDEEKIHQLRLSLKPIQLIRFMQVLGAYGFRGLVQKKQHFIENIEKGVENLFTFSENWTGMKSFPELKKLILNLNTKETKEKIKKMIV